VEKPMTICEKAGDLLIAGVLAIHRHLSPLAFYALSLASESSYSLNQQGESVLTIQELGVVFSMFVGAIRGGHDLYKWLRQRRTTRGRKPKMTRLRSPKVAPDSSP
jgi:hypothetical protein